MKCFCVHENCWISSNYNHVRNCDKKLVGIDMRGISIGPMYPSRGTHHTPEAFDHQVFGQPMLDDPVRGYNQTP
jgi:hypothetical protein